MPALAACFIFPWSKARAAGTPWVGYGEPGCKRVLLLCLGSACLALLQGRYFGLEPPTPQVLHAPLLL